MDTSLITSFQPPLVKATARVQSFRPEVKMTEVQGNLLVVCTRMDLQQQATHNDKLWTVIEVASGKGHANINSTHKRWRLSS